MSGAGVKILGGIHTSGQIGSTPSGPGQWSADLNSFQVDFNRDEFAKLISAKGYDVVWEKAAICPNRKGTAPKDHNFACPTCDGRGFVYFDAVTTRMLMTGIKMTESYYAYGKWDGGSVMVTALPDFQINYWDRLTVFSGTNRFQEIVFRQAAGLVDRLKYTPTCISYVSWMDRTDTAVQFDTAADVVITDTGLVQWVSASKPDAGSYYTIVYEYSPQYIIMDLVHQIRESTVGAQHFPFPLQAVAKLDFLTRDEGKDEPEDVPEDPFKP